MSGRARPAIRKTSVSMALNAEKSSSRTLCAEQTRTCRLCRAPNESAIKSRSRADWWLEVTEAPSQCALRALRAHPQSTSVRATPASSGAASTLDTPVGGWPKKKGTGAQRLSDSAVGLCAEGQAADPGDCPVASLSRLGRAHTQCRCPRGLKSVRFGVDIRNGADDLSPVTTMPWSLRGGQTIERRPQRCCWRCRLRASGPTRPKIPGSPPLSLTTSFPSQASLTISSLIVACLYDVASPPRLPTYLRAAGRRLGAVRPLCGCGCATVEGAAGAAFLSCNYLRSAPGLTSSRMLACVKSSYTTTAIGTARPARLCVRGGGDGTGG